MPPVHGTSGKTRARAGGRDVGRAEQRLEQEDGHLGARDGVAGAVVAAAAAAGDAAAGQVLDPRVEGAAGAGTSVNTVPVQAGGRVAGAEQGLQQEDGHLGARDGVVAAVGAAAAAGRHAVADELLDGVVKDVGLRRRR